jgi:protein-disulfide isomerase
VLKPAEGEVPVLPRRNFTMAKSKRLWLLAVLLPLAIIAVVTLSLRANAQSGSPSPLRPPKGASVALVVFEDLQCPDCARANPLLIEAAAKYKIPLLRYDFPLRQHDWAFDAAVLARYFESKSQKLGDEYRNYIFQHQAEITKASLRDVTERWAQAHKTSVPFLVDPQGKFAEEIKSDQNLGQRVGINHTPTIYVVTNKRQGTPFVEVVDRSQLFQMIDAMKAEVQ